MAHDDTPLSQHALRDQLAIQRTRLAEERTYLSYIRTGMSLLLGGIFFVGYFPPGELFSYAGYITIIVALLFLGYGLYHHRKSLGLIEKAALGLLKLGKD